MFWYFLRIIFSITVPTFYKKFQGRNLQRIKVKNPVLIAMNHPNAFLDAIAFSTLLHSPRTYYMARGDAFKKGFVSFVLESVGIVPIFRMRDGGIEGVKKNNQSFRRVYAMLNAGKKIMVFAEGLCMQERRLRSIQKGTARMAFGFMEEYNNQDLLIVPVGLNYSKPEKFRSDLFYDVGEPIAVKEYYTLYKENPAKAVNALTQEIEQRMKPLVAHLNDTKNDQLIEELQEIYKQQWIEGNKLDFDKLEHHQLYWEHIVAALNKGDVQQPDKLERLRKAVHQYTVIVHQLKLRDHLIRSASKEEKHLGWLKILLLIVGFPVYRIGQLTNYTPYFISKKFADKQCKEIEFHSSVNVVVGSFLVLVFYLLELLIVWLVFNNWWMLAVYTLVKMTSGWVSLYFSPFKKKVAGVIRLNQLKKNNNSLYQSLIQQRNEIVDIIGKLR